MAFIPSSVLSALVGCYSLTKLTPDSTYSGPLAAACATGEAAGTPTTGSRDISANVDGTPNLTTAIADFGASFKYWKLYDQSGNANHTAATTVVADRPTRATTLIGKENWYGATNTCRFTLPATVAIASRRNVTLVSVVCGGNQLASGTAHGIVSVSTVNSTATYFNLITNASGLAVLSNSFATSEYGIEDAAPTFVAAVSSASSLKLSRNAEVRTLTAVTDATSLTSGYIGTNAGSYGPLAHRHWCDLIFNRALTDPELAELYAALTTIFAIQEKTSQIVYFGDSIQSGQGATENRNKQYYMEGGLSRSPYQVNVGRSGANSTTMLSPDMTQAKLNNWEDGPWVKKIASCNIGTNDIAAGTTAATLQTNITTLIGRCITAGFYPIIETIIPRSGGSTFTAPQEAERSAYNAWLIANVPGLGGSVVDYSADTIALSDGVHPTSAGYQTMAARALPVYNGVLGYDITADAGSYELSGTPANLLKLGAYAIIALPGSYAITGSAVAVNRTIAAAAGSYAITGTEVIPRHTVLGAGGDYFGNRYFGNRYFGDRYWGLSELVAFSVTATPGSYLLTGHNIAIQRTHAYALSPLLPGAYTLAGTTATPYHTIFGVGGDYFGNRYFGNWYFGDRYWGLSVAVGYAITADVPGSYTLTGHNVALQRTGHLALSPLLPGEYILTGTDAVPFITAVPPVPLPIGRNAVGGGRRRWIKGAPYPWLQVPQDDDLDEPLDKVKVTLPLVEEALEEIQLYDGVPAWWALQNAKRVKREIPDYVYVPEREDHVAVLHAIMQKIADDAIARRLAEERDDEEALLLLLS